MGIFLLLSSLFLGPLPKVDESNLPKVLEELRGEVVIVNFWATWCGPCREEFPELVSIFEERKSDGLVVVSISMDEPEDAGLAQEFLSSQGATFPSYIRDFRDFEVFVNLINPEWSGALPSTFIFSRTGELAYSKVGKVSREELEEQIGPLLRE